MYITIQCDLSKFRSDSSKSVINDILDTTDSCLAKLDESIKANVMHLSHDDLEGVCYRDFVVYDFIKKNPHRPDLILIELSCFNTRDLFKFDVNELETNYLTYNSAIRSNVSSVGSRSSSSRDDNINMIFVNIVKALTDSFGSYLKHMAICLCDTNSIDESDIMPLVYYDKSLLRINDDSTCNFLKDTKESYIDYKNNKGRYIESNSPFLYILNYKLLEYNYANLSDFDAIDDALDKWLDTQCILLTCCESASLETDMGNYLKKVGDIISETYLYD